MAHLFKAVIRELLPRVIMAAIVILCYFLYYKRFPWDAYEGDMSMTQQEELKNLVRQALLETESQQQQQLELQQGAKVKVNIIPRYDCSTMWLNSRDLQPDNPDWYPIWIALYFRHQGRCKLIPPSWLSRDELWRIQETELRSDMFAKMTAERYISMAKMIHDTCPHDVLDGEDLKALVRDIFEARTAKLRKGKAKLIGQEEEDHMVRVPDSELTQGEMCPDRPLYPKALEELHRFRKTVRVTPIDGKRDPPGDEVKVTYSVVTLL